MSEKIKVTVIKTPDDHGKGRNSPPCDCLGQTGIVVGGDDLLAIVRLDKGGRVGIPTDCIFP